MGKKLGGYVCDNCRKFSSLATDWIKISANEVYCSEKCHKKVEFGESCKKLVDNPEKD